MLAWSLWDILALPSWWQRHTGMWHSPLAAPEGWAKNPADLTLCGETNATVHQQWGCVMWRALQCFGQSLVGVSCSQCWPKVSNAGWVFFHYLHVFSLPVISPFFIISGSKSLKICHVLNGVEAGIHLAVCIHPCPRWSARKGMDIHLSPVHLSKWIVTWHAHSSTFHWV